MSVDMSVTVVNKDGEDLEIEPTFGAGRMTLRPMDWNQPGQRGGGHYQAAVTFSNTVGLPSAAGMGLYVVRWGSEAKLMVLKRLSIYVVITTAFTNSQVLDYDVIRIGNFSQPPVGGTALLTTKNAGSFQMRTDKMQPSLIFNTGSIQYSSGGAIDIEALQIDDGPFGYAAAGIQSGAAANNIQSFSPEPAILFETRDFGVHEQVFLNNQGFAIRNGTTYGAAGVVKHGVIMNWVEAADY